ncbi:MAG: two component, sigma54 specific, transcriptional regulator, Fis family [bacterium]|nr:two component, sigma54 specific, transcriptional regulator, Fis family [bacterium]
MSRLLVVDDEPGFAKLVQALLGGDHVIDEVSSAEAALASLDEVAYDVVLTDLHMPPGPTGIELMKRARERLGPSGVAGGAERSETNEDIPFIVLTGHATVESAVEAMREGAFDYLRKAASGDELRTSVQRALGHGRMLREVRRLRGEVAEARGLGDRPVGNSQRIREVMALAERVAASDASVMIYGESGTGKELLARVIHRSSTRRDGPFVAFDCSALAPSLVESELFGHEKGAFTGAQRARRGLFREASGGTLFLDEIGDVAPEVQNKLLRVIQEREIKPVGGDVFVKIDVRILAATNKNLRQLIRDGKFREDLYYRLAVVPIELPPLRERKEDIPELVAYFLARRKGAGPRPHRMSPSALMRLDAYQWPGNIRELENVIERAAILSDGQEIHAKDLPPLDIVHVPSATIDAALDSTRPLKDRVGDAVRAVEKQAIVEALQAESGSPTRAAKRLGISRASFYNKLKEHDIRV